MNKKFTYKLTDTTLTLTIDGQQYPFRRTSGIKPDGHQSAAGRHYVRHGHGTEAGGLQDRVQPTEGLGKEK